MHTKTEHQRRNIKQKSVQNIERHLKRRNRFGWYGHGRPKCFRFYSNGIICSFKNNKTYCLITIAEQILIASYATGRGNFLRQGTSF